MALFDKIKQALNIQPQPDTDGSQAAGDDHFVADSFSFGVEREMKESGEKGGTEDINIGVGELQEADEKPAAFEKWAPAGDGQGSGDESIGVGELQPADGSVKPAEFDKWSPAGEPDAVAQGAFKNVEGLDSETEVIENHTPPAEGFQVGGSSGDDVPTEQVSLNFEKIKYVPSSQDAETPDDWQGTDGSDQSGEIVAADFDYKAMSATEGEVPTGDIQGAGEPSQSIPDGTSNTFMVGEVRLGESQAANLQDLNFETQMNKASPTTDGVPGDDASTSYDKASPGLVTGDASPSQAGETELNFEQLKWMPAGGDGPGVPGQADDAPHQQINQITSFLDGSMAPGDGSVLPADETSATPEEPAQGGSGDLFEYDDDDFPAGNQPQGPAPDGLAAESDGGEAAWGDITLKKGYINNDVWGDDGSAPDDLAAEPELADAAALGDITLKRGVVNNPDIWNDEGGPAGADTLGQPLQTENMPAIPGANVSMEQQDGNEDDGSEGGSGGEGGGGGSGGAGGEGGSGGDGGGGSGGGGGGGDDDDMPSPVDNSLMSHGGPGVPGGDVSLNYEEIKTEAGEHVQTPGSEVGYTPGPGDGEGGGPVPGVIRPAEFQPVQGELPAVQGPEMDDEETEMGSALVNLGDSGEMMELGDGGDVDPADLADADFDAGDLDV
jgi:hypothetical protein